VFTIKDHFEYSEACFKREPASQNQDLCICTDFSTLPTPYGKGTVRIVMDGMGQGDGKEAVEIAAQALLHHLTGQLALTSRSMADYLESSSLIAETSVLAWITAVLCAPIVGEGVFRGLCYTRLKQGMPMFAAMLISAWGFGMVHGTIIWMLYASLFGFILAWLYEKYRSLTACIIMHLSFNLFGQLMTLLTEIPDAAFWLLLAAGGIASAALLLHVEKQSPHKIEFTMPEAPAEGGSNNG